MKKLMINRYISKRYYLLIDKIISLLNRSATLIHTKNHTIQGRWIAKKPLIFGNNPGKTSS